MVTSTSLDGDLRYLQTEKGDKFTFNRRTYKLFDQNQNIAQSVDASPQTTPQLAYP